MRYEQQLGHSQEQSFVKQSAPQSLQKHLEAKLLFRSLQNSIAGLHQSRVAMEDSTTNGETIVTETERGRPRNMKEMLRRLKKQGSIFFEKTLPRTSAQNLHTSKSQLGIPRWFVESHGDKFGEIASLVAAPTTGTWTVRLGMKCRKLDKYVSSFPSTFLGRGWNEFAVCHGLLENDRVILSLTVMSKFEVYIFNSSGKPKGSSFPTSREPSVFPLWNVHDLLQKKVYGKSGEGATEMEGKGKTAKQLVEDEIAQLVNARRERYRRYDLKTRSKKDAIRSQKPLHSALNIFKPHFVHKISLQYRHIPEVISQEPSDDVHQELVMPFTKNFVETKIIPIGFENENQCQTGTHTSALSFLSPSTFRNNNLGRNLRVQTVVTGIPEMNGETGDRASHLLPVVQSDPSPVVHSHPSHVVHSNPSASVQSDPSAVEKSKPSAVVQSYPPAAVQPLGLENRKASEQPIVSVPTANGKTRRKHQRPWTLWEVTTLVECVARCGVGKWANIKKLGFASCGYRTVVDLKDKWRNLVRASHAQVHSPKQGERKKQSSSIPAPILARVRELAFVLNQIPLDTVFVSSTSRKWRVVRRT